MTKHRIYTTSVASVYPHYVAKAEKKGRARVEVGRTAWGVGHRVLRPTPHASRPLTKASTPPA
jgi:hypothetical protein